MGNYLLPILGMLGWLNISAPKVINRPFPAHHLRNVNQNYIVIHYDSSPSPNITLRYLRHRGNAYHYLIDKTGVVIKLIDPKYQGRHAGLSYFDGHFELNKYSIGICLVNNGTEPFTEAQYSSLIWLIYQLERRYPDITENHIVGHSDIAIPRGRKKDPGPQFNWAKLYTGIVLTTALHNVRK